MAKFILGQSVKNSLPISPVLMTGKVKGMYLLFEEEIEKEKDFVLSEEHLKILEAEREKHLSGKSKSYSPQEATEIIRGKRKL